MRLEIGRIDHDRLAFSPLGRQAIHHQGEHALVAPPLPAVIERLCRTIFPRRIPPPQAVAIDEDNAAQYATVINPGSTMALGEKTAEAEPFARPSAKKDRSSLRLLTELESDRDDQINGS